MELRPYQQKALDGTREAFRRSNKVILMLPTGAGKTAVAMHMVKSAVKRGNRVAFIADRLNLVDQTQQVMYKHGLDFGVIQGNNDLTDYSKPFQICSAQTLARRGGASSFDFVIIDEAHVMYKQQLEMLKNNPDTFFVGLTATPFTRGLGKYWDEIVVGPTTGELIRDGFLSEFRIFGPSSPDLAGIKMSAGDYNKKDLAARTDTQELTGDIVEHWFKLGRDRKTVAVAVNVAHAEHIAESFKAKGIRAAVVHCYLSEDEVKRVLHGFKHGKTQLLASVDMVSRGFDMPSADCLIIARPTKSLNYHLQVLGRVLRIAEGKEDALILDHAGNVERLGFPDDDFDYILDKGEKNRNMECIACGWQGSASIEDKCPACGGRLKPCKPKSEEKLPEPCPECFFVFKGQTCPKCGFEKKRKSKVEVVDGELEEMRRKNHKSTKTADKLKIYAKLLAGAKCAGFSEGWAAHQYRSCYGVWPAKKVDIDESFYGFINKLPRKQMMNIIWGLTS